MFQEGFILLLTGLILLLPLAFWMYIFVSFFEYGVSRRQFFFGIIAGGLTTLPLVYNDMFFLGGILENVFFYLSVLESQVFSGSIFLYLSLFFLCLWGASFLLGYYLQTNKKKFFKVQKYSFLAFGALLVGGVCDIVLFQSLLQNEIPETAVVFGDFAFLSVGAVFSYYIVTAFLEEGSKYIWSTSFSGRRDYFTLFQKYICLSACVALGFAFFENILYTFSYISREGTSLSLLQVVFFRSIFSVILHLTASMLFAIAFWHIFSNLKLWSFLGFSALAIGSHVFFDVALNFGYISVIFFYSIVIYLLLTYLNLKGDLSYESSE